MSLKTPALGLRLAIVVASAFAALVAAEGVLRFRAPRGMSHYVWVPHLREVFKPDPRYIQGITGDSRVFTNAVGLRGDELPDGNHDRMLAIGGSTTECVYLDQDETWPALLQQTLGKEPGAGVWVGNAGKSGIGAAEHVLQVRYLLDEIPRVRRLIVMLGANDLASRLSRDEAYQPDRSPIELRADTLGRAFSRITGDDFVHRPFYRRTELWFLLSGIARWYRAQGDEQDHAGQMYVARRAARHKRPMRSRLPDLTSALDEYRWNLGLIAAQAERHQVSVVFVTQPTLWRQGLTDAEDRLLWFGWAAPSWDGPSTEYYSAAALEQGMRQYNTALLDFCRDRDVSCVDLASAVPKTTDYFYDDMHFTEKGAALVAELLARSLSGPVLASAAAGAPTGH